MPLRDWRVRIEDILGCIARIQRYTAGRTFETFVADEMVVDAVERNFITIGEATSHIPREVVQRYPDVPWTRMRGMRNIVAHGYFAVSLQIVWETVQNDLPLLAALLRQILEHET